MPRFRSRYLVLIVSILVLLSGVILSSNVQNSFGTVIVTEEDFPDMEGAIIHSTLQRPVYATNSNPLPGVVVIHGSLQNKEWLMAFGIELARRGFVVLTIDANGHGNSDPGNRTAGVAALEYLANLDFVDESEMGLIGHSMGGGYVWSAVNQSTVTVDALVLVGAWVVNSSSVPYTPNTLVAVGDFSSLSSYPSNPTLLDPYFNVTGVEPGITYGSFDDSTARRLILGRTNHLFETIEPVIVSESIDWMKESLKDGVEDSYWLASSNLLYPLWLVGGFLSLVGAILTIFPLISMLSELPVFESLKGSPELGQGVSNREFLGKGALYGAIGVGTFFPFLAVGTILGFVIPFPQYYGLSVMSWMLGSGLVAALALYFIFGLKGETGAFRKLAGMEEGLSKLLPSFIKSLVLAAIIIVWLYCWTLMVDVGLALDLRVFLPGFHDLTLRQALLVPLYFVVFLIYFAIEGMWLTGPLLTASKDTWVKTQIHWTVKAVVIKCIPYALLIAFEYGGGLLTGASLVPGMIGFSFLFFYAFAPWFAVTTVIIMWSYRVTGNHYLGAILDGLICAWLLASILSIR
ncbi:MAG: alpha/beta fold hydrolase [Promethearchaeota archaeon]